MPCILLSETIGITTGEVLVARTSVKQFLLQTAA